MGGVKLNDDRKVFNCVLHFVQFLMGTSDQVVGIDIATVNIEEGVAIFNGVDVLAFLHVGAGANEKCFFMGGIGFKFEGADIN